MPQPSSAETSKQKDKKKLTTEPSPWLAVAEQAVQFGTTGLLELLLDVGEELEKAIWELEAKVKIPEAALKATLRTAELNAKGFFLQKLEVHYTKYKGDKSAVGEVRNFLENAESEFKKLCQQELERQLEKLVITVEEEGVAYNFSHPDDKAKYIGSNARVFAARFFEGQGKQFSDAQKEESLEKLLRNPKAKRDWLIEQKDVVAKEKFRHREAMAAANFPTQQLISLRSSLRLHYEIQYAKVVERAKIGSEVRELFNCPEHPSPETYKFQEHFLPVYLKNKVSANTILDDGSTLLHLTLRADKGRTAVKLLEYGANPFQPDLHGVSAIHVKNPKGDSLLITYAVLHEYAQALDLLKNYWMKVDLRDEKVVSQACLVIGETSKETLLHLAVRGEDLDMFKVLLFCGANLAADKRPTGNGRKEKETPWDLLFAIKSPGTKRDFIAAATVILLGTLAASASLPCGYDISKDDDVPKKLITEFAEKMLGLVAKQETKLTELQNSRWKRVLHFISRSRVNQLLAKNEEMKKQALAGTWEGTDEALAGSAKTLRKRGVEKEFASNSQALVIEAERGIISSYRLKVVSREDLERVEREKERFKKESAEKDVKLAEKDAKLIEKDEVIEAQQLELETQRSEKPGETTSKESPSSSHTNTGLGEHGFLGEGKTKPNHPGGETSTSNYQTTKTGLKVT